jgi:hypothetical protein
MAATPEGARLTRQHQQMQLKLRSLAIADWTKLWPIWDGSEARFKQLVEASVPLVQNYHRMSAGVSIDYYRRLRAAEIDTSRGTVDVPLPSIGRGEIAGTLYITGRDMTAKAIAAGHSPQAAVQNALVRTAGSMTRLILNGGRESLVQAALDDSESLGYRRITTGTCDFCAELASHGLFESRDFQAHDHCGCVAEPAFARATRAMAKITGRDKDTRSLLGLKKKGDKDAESGSGGGDKKPPKPPVKKPGDDPEWDPNSPDGKLRASTVEGEPIRNAEAAAIPEAKLRGYALDPEHPEGQHKARVFASALGIGPNDYGYLEAQLLQGLRSAPVRKVVDSPPWPPTVRVSIPVTGLNGQTRMVKTGWKYENGRPQLTTAMVE